MSEDQFITEYQAKKMKLKYLTHFGLRVELDQAIMPKKDVLINYHGNMTKVDCDIKKKSRLYDHWKWLSKLIEGRTDAYIVENKSVQRAVAVSVEAKKKSKDREEYSYQRSVYY